ncbi:hypothetical protein B0H19DRAFT_1381367 [Mycena capillaripes]|nr:hypothetical protein B0H19DRAFT_1381367 [Mycena capillaripes]
MSVKYRSRYAVHSGCTRPLLEIQIFKPHSWALFSQDTRWSLKVLPLLTPSRRPAYSAGAKHAVTVASGKWRCDGQKPVCGPCLRASHEDDCEYTAENLGRSRIEILEEDISRIQARIYELEHPEIARSSVYLYHPYREAQNPAQMAGLHQMLDTFEPSMLFESLTSTSTTPEYWWSSDEPPKHMIESFLDTFLLSASDWGFFLDVANFRRDALLPLPLGHHSRPAPALLVAVYLAAITLSTSPTVKPHEKTFLARTLSTLPSSLSGLHPQRALHTLQAEILVATYFFSAGKFTEGMYHTAAAVSLAVSSGLHKIRTGSVPMNSTEEERSDACWATLTFDKAWAVALGTHSHWNATLDMPWLTTDTEMAPKTVLTKAVILWERANDFGARWNSDTKHIEEHASDSHNDFSGAFTVLDAHIDDFRAAVTPLLAQNPTSRALILHAPFVLAHADNNNVHNQRKCLDAATAVLVAAAPSMVADTTNDAYINPIIAPVWATASRIVLEEVRVREAGGGELVEVFTRGFAAMRTYKGSCPIMYYHIEKIQEAYDALGLDWDLKDRD